MTAMVRVDEKVYAALREIADAEHRSIGQVIEEAVRRYQRERFWQGVHEDFGRLRENPVALHDYQEEIAVLEGGSMDSLEHEEPYYTPEEEAEIRAEHERSKGR
jgi:hypothetical protein